MKKDKPKVPKLRFPGFEDDWEQCKLGEVANITMGQSPSSKYYSNNPDDYILVQGNADIEAGRVKPRVWTSRVTKKANKNDILLTVRAPVGAVAISDYNVVIGRGVASIQANSFFYHLLTKMEYDNYWSRYSSGSTFQSINSNDIKRADIFISCEAEQKQIESFFESLDNLITSHQRKIKNLEKQKKALLQKMFPKKGKTKPELRFPGFTDDWEQCKLEEITTSYSGGTPSSSKKEYYGGEIPFIRSGEIQSNKTELFITAAGLENSSAKLVEKEVISCMHCMVLPAVMLPYQILMEQ